MSPKNISQATLLRERTVRVEYLDGVTSDLTVRQIKIREIDQWLNIEADEIKRVMMVTGLAEDAIDNLTPESFEELLAADEDLNDPLAQPRAQRNQKRNARQLEAMKTAMPDLYAKVEAEMKAAMQKAMASSV